MNAKVETGGFAPQLPSFADTFGAAVQTVRVWRERSRSRRALAELDPHLLKDIGLSSYDARVESIKPFWVG